MKLTLMTMASYGNNNDVCWPAQGQLAEDSEQSLDTIQRHIRELEKLGLISVHRQRRDRGYWPKFMYHLKLGSSSTEPHGAAQPSRMVRPGPGRMDTPNRAAWCGPTEPQALRLESVSESVSEYSEPAADSKSEGEPAKGALKLTDHEREFIAKREAEEKRLAEERQNRPTLEEIRSRLGHNFGLRTM